MRARSAKYTHYASQLRLKNHFLFACLSLPGSFAEALIKRVSLLKRNLLAAPFERAVAEQEQFEDEKQPNPTPEIMAVHYREGEAIYVQASHDRVTVIFSTMFREEVDRVIGKVFLQVRLNVETVCEVEDLAFVMT